MMTFLLHRTVRRHAYEIATGEELDARILRHVETCPSCRAVVADMRTTLALIDPKAFDPAADRPEMYWQVFAARVERRVALADPVRERSRLFDWFGSRPAFLAGAASALAVAAIAAGVWWWTGRGTVAEQRMNVVAPSAVTVHDRVYDYFDRSRVVLIGVLNEDTQELGRSPEMFRRNRDASRELVAEARTLNKDLVDPRDVRLRQLVNDLEVLLVQLSNLEANGDVPGLEIIRDGVHRNGVLLKITIEEMNRAPARPHPNAEDGNGSASAQRSL